MYVIKIQKQINYVRSYVDIVATSAPSYQTIYNLSLLKGNQDRKIKYISAFNVKLKLKGIKIIDPFSPLELMLYPNPATDLLIVKIKSNEAINDDVTNETIYNDIISSSTMSSTEDSYTIQLWNDRYGLVRTVEITKSDEQISLSGLPKGMYFVHLIKNKKTLQKQILWVN